MSQSITEIQDLIVADFSDFSDWSEKYEYLIELGMELPPLAPEHKIEAKRILGCQSNVWLNAEFDPQTGVIQFQADSEAMIVKGLVSLLVRMLSGHTPAEILQAELNVFQRIGLDQHLSSTRSNGLVAMIRDMKRYAAEYVATQA
ncbi:Fe-S metabolism protein SufE [bacterium (Candidatus Blackallbacteria) CG17_big_fil_post_rev_8_21_14_2_50_48_46]|uniref:Fe-S metabolism protein SufE n=1 Tax=bacterium (Candidatus Blackallbacteria) CG17_big_fil_post_rev_8_21_14_2_50_48_46 TaxID=2014261 RepID=A0A2M7GB98_9BACT|nr:MAG: Fe-S metabolism protein SufE [bacterium (Candidatus Blackallbacteria) CG18_big_fil_WC_8_21_14_2_50_49_26]PIW19462.1 MAG: Fe-S metabolism protein SufE [bacterium (Candidatus Blackallbacteria) CG17_big_fil_post_rev_8_21_14_2_50_48_46]PIW48934.1 MAG: Fe-S metabolism protein SufE [bacterium (Candidatus Blackallbacteria) CG13_big_fil_rev_8_21_14_2_50_49_14]